uniref:Zinc finger protein 541 n=1 Tax=Myotis myotis TaxID=51298 RepID=A0A7J7R954_MYOMY|nr:zinc finger protein 541 [Myotis myotis]
MQTRNLRLPYKSWGWAHSRRLKTLTKEAGRARGVRGRESGSTAPPRTRFWTAASAGRCSAAPAL